MVTSLNFPSSKKTLMTLHYVFFSGPEYNHLANQQIISESIISDSVEPMIYGGSIVSPVRTALVLFNECFASQSGQMDNILTETEKLALIIACLCHDLDHRGTNNQFQIKYGNSVVTEVKVLKLHNCISECI
jgi:hypothetical protein